jgi:hypothetical protein
MQINTPISLSSPGIFASRDDRPRAEGKALRIERDFVTRGKVMWRPLSEQSADELLARAAKYRSMAATASTQEVMDALRRLADRFEAKAAERLPERFQ